MGAPWQSQNPRRGAGSSSIVRPGVILLSPKNEYHHYYRNSAIFIFAMGEDSNTNEYIIRGVILDMPTPFTFYEMMEQQPISPDNKLLYDNHIRFEVRSPAAQTEGGVHGLHSYSKRDF